jgi:hypothetical protein
VHLNVQGNDLPSVVFFGPEKNNNGWMVTSLSQLEGGGKVPPVITRTIPVVIAAFSAMAAVQLLGKVVGIAEQSVGVLSSVGDDFNLRCPRYGSTYNRLQRSRLSHEITDFLQSTAK